MRPTVIQAAYGVRLDSEIAIDGLPLPSGAEIGAVSVVRDSFANEAPDDRALPPDAEFEFRGRTFSLRVNDGLEIRWDDTMSFCMRVGESRIRCARGPQATERQFQRWFLEYALPLHLMIERRLRFLHASAVEIDGAAVGFLAASGGGKSTTAGYLLRRGHRWISDDKLGVTHRGAQFMAAPGLPFHYADEAKTQWEPVRDFVSQPLLLGRLYVLAPSDAAAEVDIAPLSPAAAAFALAIRCEVRLPPNVRQRLGLPADTAQTFDDCSALAAAVTVRRLVVPRDRARLSEVYDAVIADVAASA